MTAIEKIIAAAKDEIGYRGKKTNSQLYDKTANAGGKYTKYAAELDAIKFYNGKKNGYDYCDVFTDWLFFHCWGEEAALELTCQPKGSCGAGVKYSASYYKTKNQFYTAKPKAGDQIFFGTSSSFTHTGLVVDVDSKYVYTVEGNTSNSEGVYPTGGCVCNKKYLLTYEKIKGYGRPNYSLVETEESNKEEENTKKVPIKGVVNASAGLNVRSGPGTTYKKVGAISSGTSMTILSVSGNWYQITTKSIEGYASSNYITVTEWKEEEQKPIEPLPIIPIPTPAVKPDSDNISSGTLTQEQFNNYMDSWLADLAKKEPNSWSASHREWAESIGLMKGDGNGLLHYQSFSTREQVVTFCHRLYDLIMDDISKK